MTPDKIGTDEWVRQYEQRLAAPTGKIQGFLREAGARVPFRLWFALLAIVGALFPFSTDNAYVMRIAATIALMATLGMGLNLVVGYAGLLDLGYVAFYGIGAYAYAYLSSDFSGVHWPTWASLLLIIVVSAVFGLLLGSPSLRLIGDYLAIVTLGFGQMFGQLTTSLTRVKLPWLEDPQNLTGGPNGILNLDPLSVNLNFGQLGVFSFAAQTVKDYYYILFGVMCLVLVFVYHLNYSRIGRAWRALREDDLAAEAMGMPTRRLKLNAFAIGAAIAGLCGALFASWQGSVFPGNFDITVLITFYAIIVLGGLGSLPGVLIAAVIMIAVPEVLRDVERAGILFYVGVLLTLYATVRPRWLIPPLLAILSLSAVGSTALLTNLWPGTTAMLSPFNSPFGLWLAIPTDATLVGNVAFVLLIILALIISRLKIQRWRFVALMPTLYLLAFVWETRLSQEPSITRLLFVGLLLVALMIHRPNGLLGQRRVEMA